jgi:rhodanese-related sulfurtransferase
MATPSIAPADLLDRIERKEPMMVLDVRTAAEFAAGHVPGAVNLPFQQVGTRAGSIPAARTDELVVYCGHGPRAWIAAAALRRAGFRNIAYLRGHWAAWRRERLREER